MIMPVVAFAGIGLLLACGQTDPAVSRADPYDPHEKFNRKVHAFNRSLDKSVLRPAGTRYGAAMPDDIETVIGRFAFNLSIPRAVVNNVLQGNMKGAVQDSARFVINTTVGLGGFFDPATEINMPEATDADFGETLYVWGVPEGAYAEVPFLGPGTDRRFAGKIVDLATNPLTYILPEPESYYGTAASISSGLSDRGRYSETIDSVLYDSADSYAQTRSLYLQNRRFKLSGDAGGAYADPYEDSYGAAVLSEDPYDE